MKNIETGNILYKNREISFCDGIKVRFNGIGQAEVEDNVFDKLMAEYPGFLFKAGKAPKNEVKENVYDDSEAKAEIEKLNKEILNKNLKIKDLKKQLEVEVGSSEEWKKNYEDLIKKNKNEDLKVEMQKKDDAIAKLETKCLLLGKPRKELVEIAVKSDFDEKEYKNFNNQELVNYLISKL